MAQYAADVSDYPLLSGKRDRIVLSADQTIGAAGAVGAIVKDDPGITVAKAGGTGTYDITFPAAPAGRLIASLTSAAGTVSQYSIAAFSATAGTAQVITRAPAGTATNPASGDVLSLVLVLDSRSDA